MTNEDMEELAFADLGRPFMKALLRSAFLAREAAWEYSTSTFAAQEAENVVPYIVRAHLEGLMRGAAERFGHRAVVVKEPAQPWNHTEIRAGRVILTAASTTLPCGLVEAAQYRLGLARTQDSLFEINTRDVDSPIYALLLHSRSAWRTEDEDRLFRHLPGSAYLALPAADLRAYIHAINLFELFPEVVREATPSHWDEPTLELYVQRSRRTA